MKMNGKKSPILILLTDSYPLGKISESFLEAETPILARYFQKTWVLPYNKISQEARPLPAGWQRVKASDSRLPLLKSYRELIKCLPLLWVEYKRLFKVHGFRYPLLRFWYLIRYLHRALNVKYRLEQLIKENALEEETIVFYSYWRLQQAMGVALYLANHPELKATFIVRAHGFDLYDDRINPKVGGQIFTDFIHQYLNQLHLVSQAGMDYLSSRYPKNCYLSPLGTAPISKEISDSLNRRPLKLISISFVKPLKRINLIIEALAGLNHPFEWIHIGGGSALEALKQKAQKMLTSKENAQFTFMGYQSNQKVRDFLAKNDFHTFISTSSTEGKPVSMMEALSARIPLIGTAVGGVSEIIQEGYNGFLLSENPTIEEITASLNRVIDLSESDYQKLRQNAFKTWEEDYQASNNFDTFSKKLYNP